MFILIFFFLEITKHCFVSLLLELGRISLAFPLVLIPFHVIFVKKYLAKYNMKVNGFSKMLSF